MNYVVAHWDLEISVR